MCTNYVWYSSRSLPRLSTYDVQVMLTWLPTTLHVQVSQVSPLRWQLPLVSMHPERNTILTSLSHDPTPARFLEGMGEGGVCDYIYKNGL